MQSWFVHFNLSIQPLYRNFGYNKIVDKSDSNRFNVFSLFSANAPKWMVTLEAKGGLKEVKDRFDSPNKK